MPDRPSILAILRTALLLILVAGMLGTVLELLLLEHTEGVWQLAPVVLLAAGLVAVLWHALTRSRASLRAVQVVMLAFLLSGLAGLVLHYRGNLEFELELHASAQGWELIRAALGGATPTLAPGTMIQLGLIGLLYSYRHPALGGGRTGPTNPES